eukprot:1219397-Lingulodinium_polyedra.AAC.1
MFFGAEETHRERVDGWNVRVTTQPLVRVGNLPNMHIALGYLPPRSAELVVKTLTELIEHGPD